MTLLTAICNVCKLRSKQVETKGEQEKFICIVCRVLKKEPK